MNKEEHDAYVEYVKIRDADQIIEHEKNLKEMWPNNNSTYYDIKGNKVSFGLYACLQADRVYSYLKEDTVYNFQVITCWTHTDFDKCIIVFIVDHENKYTFIGEYSSEKEAIKEHENVVKQIEEGAFSISTHQDCN